MKAMASQSWFVADRLPPAERSPAGPEVGGSRVRLGLALMAASAGVSLTALGYLARCVASAL